MKATTARTPLRNPCCGQWSFVLLVSCWALSAGGPARADFGEAVPLADEGTVASGAAIGLDPAGNAYLVSIADDQVVVEVIGPDLRLSTVVPESGAEQRTPLIVSNSRGQTFVSFSRSVAPEPGEGGADSPAGSREVVLTSNGGGRFLEPRAVASLDGDVDDAKLTLDRDGQPHFVWARREGGPLAPSRVYHLGPDAVEPTEIAPGSHPGLLADRLGVLEFFFFHDRGIHEVEIRGEEIREEELVISTTFDALEALQVERDSLGNTYLMYASGGSVYLTRRRPGLTFDPPRVIAGGGAEQPDFDVQSRGVVNLVYTKDGDIHLVQGLGEFLLPPTPVTPAALPGVEEHDPSLAVDASGILHVTFLREGRAYYMNTAGQVSAEFTASQQSGEGPLEVQFQDLSSGDVKVWQWNFGDGSFSNLQHPVHEYTEPGKYTVSLTVFSADKESKVTKEDFVLVQEQYNSLEIPDQTVLPNQKEVWFPVIASHDQAIQAYQIHAMYDPNVLELRECTQELTAVQALSPDIWYFTDDPDRGLELGVIFEVEPPFPNPHLPAGDHHILAQFIFDISPNAPQGGVTELRLVNNSDVSRIFNIFTVDGFTKLPKLESSRVQIGYLFPIPQFFLRGDVDDNGRVEITDAIRMLNFLFLGGEPPVCKDAGDVTDSGRLDISSPISILNYLFLGGSPPRVPFPNKGIDPTEDSLGCRGRD